jgi:hypothetical protein
VKPALNREDRHYHAWPYFAEGVVELTADEKKALMDEVQIVSVYLLRIVMRLLSIVEKC